MGEQLLPNAPTHRSGKASPYLAILLTCLFPFHLSSFSKQSLLFVVHHPGQASVTFLREQEEERSWVAQRRRLLTVCWVWKAHRFCNTVLMFACGLLNHICTPYNQQHRPHRMGDRERTAGGRKGKERKQEKKKGKEKGRRWKQPQPCDLYPFLQSPKDARLGML